MIAGKRGKEKDRLPESFRQPVRSSRPATSCAAFFGVRRYARRQNFNCPQHRFQNGSLSGSVPRPCHSLVLYRGSSLTRVDAEGKLKPGSLTVRNTSAAVVEAVLRTSRGYGSMRTREYFESWGNRPCCSGSKGSRMLRRIVCLKPRFLALASSMK